MTNSICNQKFSEKYRDVDFDKINVDDMENLASKYGVAGIPHFIFLDAGTIWGFKHEGADIVAIENYIYNIRMNN